MQNANYDGDEGDDKVSQMGVQAEVQDEVQDVQGIQSDKWVYTKGLLMTIEGARLKAHMVQTLYRKAKESELGDWNVPFTNQAVRDALDFSLQKSLPTFEPAHRAKFPDLTDNVGIGSLFQKIKANFEKGRLKTYMRESDGQGLGPPMAPEEAEPDLEMADSKIIYHKTWLQNYAWFVCHWMDRSGKSLTKKRCSTGAGKESPNVAAPSRKRPRKSLQPVNNNTFSAFSNGSGGNVPAMPGIAPTNLEGLGPAMSTSHTDEHAGEDVLEMMQFGFKWMYALIVASAPGDGIDRMRMVAQRMAKAASEQQSAGMRQDAQQLAKYMSDAVNGATSLY